LSIGTLAVGIFDHPYELLHPPPSPPEGVKKPYNPLLGEMFRAEWDHGAHGRTFFFAEQVSHHPPVSTFFLSNPSRNYMFAGHIHPKSRFLGNSAASILEGEAVLTLTKPTLEEYHFTFPSYYARGIIVGTLRMELEGTAVITCDQTGFVAELEFKNKVGGGGEERAVPTAQGFFRGEHNSLHGKIKRKGSKEVLFNLDGRWDRAINISEHKGHVTPPPPPCRFSSQEWLSSC
jgi:oxysterol-binding protein-related protein 8